MHPVLFDSKIFIIYSLWLFFTLGFSLSAFILYKLIQASRLDISFITNHFAKLFVTALITSRVFAIFNNPVYFFRGNADGGFSIFGTLWNFITIWDKELSFWGAVLGFFFVFIHQAQKEKQNFAKWADILTISIISGISIGNIGAYLDGIHYGKPTILPWGVTFQSSFVKYAVPIHPTQIYAFLYTGFIALFLYYLYKQYRSKYDGIITYTGFFMFSVFRFFEGFLRGDDVLILGTIRTPQLIFFIVAILSGTLMYKYQKRYNIPIFKQIPKFLHLDRINWQKLQKIRIKK